MDWLVKALLVAGTVLLVMWVARQGGRRLAGMVAGLPTITAPTLAWLAHEEGVTFAVSAAIGGVAACAVLAVFALGYARAAHSGRGAAVALLCGLCGGLAMAVPAEFLSANLAEALVLALAVCAICFAALPGSDADVVSPRRSRRTMLILAAASGALTVLAVAVGPSMGAFATGLLSSLPVISASIAVFEHTACGHPAATHFLRGYVGGLLGKAGFGVVFALLAPRLGVPAALLLACACACLLSAPGGWRLLPRAASLPVRASRQSE